MDFDLPADDDPRRLAIRAWLADHPHPDRTADRRGRLCGAALATAVGSRRRPDAPADHRTRTANGRRVAAEQSDRDRVGGADDPAGGHRRAEAAVPAADPQRRGVLVPTVQRTRLRFRPGEPRHPRRARRRRVRDQRLEDLVERCAPRPVRDPHRPDRPQRPQAQGHLLLHPADGHARAVDAPDRRHDDGALVQPTVLRRHAASGLAPRRRGGRRVAARQGHARQRAGVAVVSRLAVGDGPVGRGAHRPRAHVGPIGGGVVDRLLRDRLARLYCDAEVLRLNRLRSLSAKLHGRTPGRRGVDPEDHGRRARSARDEPRQGPRRHRRCVDGIRSGGRDPGPHAQRRDRDQVPPRRGEPVPRRRSDLALRLPVLTGAHARRRHVRGAAQHRRRTGAGAAPRARCRTRDGVGRDPHETVARDQLLQRENVAT